MDQNFASNVSTLPQPDDGGTGMEVPTNNERNSRGLVLRLISLGLTIAIAVFFVLIIRKLM